PRPTNATVASARMAASSVGVLSLRHGRSVSSAAVLPGLTGEWSLYFPRVPKLSPSVPFLFAIACACLLVWFAYRAVCRLCNAELASCWGNVGLAAPIPATQSHYQNFALVGRGTFDGVCAILSDASIGCWNLPPGAVAPPIGGLFTSLLCAPYSQLAPSSPSL